jgi:uncharacterized membrane protein YoaK (UPF0700 family)
MKDTVQIITANIGAVGISLAGVNDILTFLSLSLAIVFTIYKFQKLKNNNN